MTNVHPDRLFPPEPGVRAIARELYASVCSLPVAAMGSMPADDFAEAAARLAYEASSLSRLQIEQSPLDDLSAYEALRTGEWQGRVVPVYCADDVVDPETPGFVDHLDRLGQLTGCDAYTWKGYLEAHGIRRDIFKLYGCRATVHRHQSARAEELDTGEKTALFRKVCIGKANPAEAELFRAVMLVEMARMSVEDGLSLHIYAGQGRAARMMVAIGDSIEIPLAVDYARSSAPLLSRFGRSDAFGIVFFTPDPQAAMGQLAPLALALPALQIGFSGGAGNRPGRLRAFRQQIVDAGVIMQVAPLQPLSNRLADLALQNDTTRRIDCAVLAALVATHEMSHEDAAATARHWALT